MCAVEQAGGGAPAPARQPAHTLSLPYNDADAVREVMDRQGNEIAAVIVEPVAGNMGLVPPVDGFLTALKDVTRAHGSLLIFRVRYHRQKRRPRRVMSNETSIPRFLCRADQHGLEITPPQDGTADTFQNRARELAIIFIGLRARQPRV